MSINNNGLDVRNDYGRDSGRYCKRLAYQCLRCVKQTQDNLQAFQGIIIENFPDRNTDVLRELDGLDVLQICLLQTEPFDCAPSMIKNMHTGQKLPCPDRPILLSSLAEALASLQPPYWWLLIALELELKDPKVFTEIRSFIDIYFKTYFAYQSYEGSAPNSDIKHLQQKTMVQVYELMAEYISSLTPEDYTAIAYYAALNQSKHVKRDQSKRVKRELTTKMWHSFDKYTPRPDRDDPRFYHDQAIYHAIAAILRYFKIEDGEQSIFAGRICKRLQRQGIKKKSA